MGRDILRAVIPPAFWLGVWQLAAMWVGRKAISAAWVAGDGAALVKAVIEGKALLLRQGKKNYFLLRLA